MSEVPISVLVISDDVGHRERVRRSLGRAGARQHGARGFQVESTGVLADALEWLHEKDIDVVLLDHAQPGGHESVALDLVLEAAPLALVLERSSEAGDVTTIHYAARTGARDGFVNDHLDIRRLPEALRFAVARRADREALRNSEARFRAMSDASPLGIFVADVAGGCVYTNAAYQEISGLTFEQALGTRWSVAIHPQDRDRVLSDWQAAARGNEPFQSEFRFQRRDGSVVWTRVNSAAMSDGRGIHGHVQTVEDITARKSTEFGLRAAEKSLFDEKERAQVTLNSIGDAVISTDLTGNVTFLNQVAETMTGWSCHEALGQPLADVFRILDGATRMTAADPARRAIESDQTVGLAAGCVLLRRDGTEVAIEDSAAPIHGRDGRATGAVIVFHDIGQSQAMAERNSHLAYHDSLTGLSNRVLLNERISQAIGLAGRHDKKLALLFIDLDNFKRINDSLGHGVGDQLLRLVAARMAACVRATDTLCRQGGDEFVMLLTEIEQPKDAAQVVEKLRSAVAAPYLVAGHELHVTVSVGISVFPSDGIDADTLMQKADTAMYHAKANGRDSHLFFRPSMNARAVRRLAVETGLRHALTHGGLVLHYQPKMNLASGAATGCEALVRWQETEQRIVYPEQFLSIAEDCGLIVPIGQWVLREACRQTVAWLKEGLPAMPVAVNISAVEFRSMGFLNGVATILQETGMTPDLLEFELTESVLMHDVEASLNVLEALKDMGIGLAIDDFGTGYSSLTYLRRFPIGTLKIDQLFVRDITTDADDASIVSAVIEMGKVLKRRVVAEGVETGQQLEFLKAHDCDEGQGFHFSRPLSATDYAGMLRTTGAV